MTKPPPYGVKSLFCVVTAGSMNGLSAAALVIPRLLGSKSKCGDERRNSKRWNATTIVAKKRVKKELNSGDDSKEDKGVIGKQDLMQLEFGRLLGESSQTTLTKVIGRKLNSNLSFVEIEKLSARMKNQAKSKSVEMKDVLEAKHISAQLMAAGLQSGPLRNDSFSNAGDVKTKEKVTGKNPINLAPKPERGNGQFAAPMDTSRERFKELLSGNTLRNIPEGEKIVPKKSVPKLEGKPMLPNVETKLFAGKEHHSETLPQLAVKPLLSTTSMHVKQESSPLNNEKQPILYPKPSFQQPVSHHVEDAMVIQPIDEEAILVGAFVKPGTGMPENQGQMIESMIKDIELPQLAPKPLGSSGHNSAAAHVEIRASRMSNLPTVVNKPPLMLAKDHVPVAESLNKKEKVPEHSTEPSESTSSKSFESRPFLLAVKRSANHVSDNNSPSLATSEQVYSNDKEGMVLGLSSTCSNGVVPDDPDSSVCFQHPMKQKHNRKTAALASRPVLPDTSNIKEIVYKKMEPANQQNEDSDWAQAEALHGTKSVIEVEFIRSNAGGMIVKFGSLVGFLPGSELAVHRGLTPYTSWAKQNSKWSNNNQNVNDSALPEKNVDMTDPIPDLQALYRNEKMQLLSSLIGKKANVILTSVNRKERRLLFSEKKADPEYLEFTQKKLSLMGRLKVGDVVTCVVSKIDDLGIRVELQGVTLPIHKSELSWHPSTSPASLVHVGQEIKVKVCGFDYNLERINLSMKQMNSDPLQETLESLLEGNNQFHTGNNGLVEQDTEVIQPREFKGFLDKLENAGGVQVVVRGRRLKSSSVAPNFQVYLSTSVDNSYKIVARLGNEIQEILVQSSLDREMMKGLIQASTNTFD